MTTHEGQVPISYRNEACPACGQQMVVYMTGVCANCGREPWSEDECWESLMQGFSEHHEGKHDYWDKDPYDCSLCHILVKAYRDAVAWTERVQWHEERYWLRFALQDIAGERWAFTQGTAGSSGTVAGSVARIALAHSDERKASAERSRAPGGGQK